MKYTSLLILLIFVACKTDSTGWDKLSNGYEYVKHTNSDKPNPKKGEVVILDLEVIDDQGVTLDDSREAKQKPSFVIPQEDSDQLRRNPLLGLVALMAEGDSATVRVPLDSLPSAPETFRHSTYLDYTIRVYTIQDAEFYAQQQKSIADKQTAKYTADAEKVFKAYMDNTLNAKEVILPSGVKVSIIKDTKEAKPVAGDRVSVNYYGFFRDGSSFDNSYKAGRPFSFTIGQGGAIRGWQVGIPELSKGGTAILDIPYEYAYGAHGNPPVIPAQTDLIFFVELENIIKGK